MLTEEEKKLFHTQGYLVVPRAISAAHIERLHEAIRENSKDGLDKLHNTADILGRHDAFTDLVDLPTVLPKICGILGWNIWANHSHFNVNPPESLSPTDPFSYEWHRDGGAMGFDLGDIAAPLLSLKVGFYLTDLRRPGHGQTYIVPGSHLRTDNQYTRFDEKMKSATQLEFGPQSRPDEIGAVALDIEPGTAVIYDRRTIHSAYSPNTSSITRLAAFVNFGFRWLQPMDSMTVEHLLNRCDPVRQQLLGLTATVRPLLGRAATGMSGRYYPSNEDVPLRSFI